MSTAALLQRLKKQVETGDLGQRHDAPPLALLSTESSQPNQPAEWDSETAALIEWLRTLDRSTLPPGPIEISKAWTILDPVRYANALLADATEGPKGPRARYGAFPAELRAFHQLITDIRS
jgi:hypothetical protein